MVRTIEGKLIARGKKFGIVASRFNDFITKRLVEATIDTLLRHDAKETDVEVVWVPGSFEIPPLAQKMAKGKRYDAIICLGTLIKGATPHFEYLALQAVKGVADVSLNSEKPVIFGVITADTLEQAIERAGTKEGNKGNQAALAAIEMANLYEKIKN